MKNLAVLDLNDVEVLPSKESRKQYITGKYGNMYSLSKFDNGTSSVKSPWVFNNNLSKRIIKKYVDKPFDDAYSEYCKKAKLEDKDVFHTYFKHNRYRTFHYCVNDEGIIKKVNDLKLNFIYKVYSWDYVAEYVYNIKTGRSERIIISGQVFEFKHKNHLYWKKFYEQRAMSRKAKRNNMPKNNLTASDVYNITKSVDIYCKYLKLENKKSDITN